MPRLRVSMGKFRIENAVLGVPRWKTVKFFPIRPFAYLLQLKCFFEWPYFQKSTLSRKLVARLVDHHGWLKNPHDIQMTSRTSIHRFTSVQTKMYIFICYQPDKYTRQEQSQRNMVIYSKFTEPMNLPLLNTTPYMVEQLLYFFQTPHFIWKYCPNEIQDKHTKNSQEKVISSNQHYMPFTSDSCNLIKNNKNLRYHNVPRKTSATASKHQHLNVKVIEWDISQS